MTWPRANPTQLTWSPTSWPHTLETELQCSVLGCENKDETDRVSHRGSLISTLPHIPGFNPSCLPGPLIPSTGHPFPQLWPNKNSLESSYMPLETTHFQTCTPKPFLIRRKITSQKILNTRQPRFLLFRDSRVPASRDCSITRF